jgi:hypothetical protein
MPVGTEETPRIMEPEPEPGRPHPTLAQETLSEGSRAIALTAGAAAIGSLIGPDGTLIGALLGVVIAAVLAATKRHRDKL